MTPVNPKGAAIEGSAGSYSARKLCQCSVSSFGSCVKAAIAMFPSNLAAKLGYIGETLWHLALTAFGNVLMHFFAATAQ